MYDSSWLEVSDEGDSLTIHANGYSCHITKFDKSDWQIDIESDEGAGTYGAVNSKQNAIDYVLEKAGIIENSGVQPKQVIIT